MWPIVGHEWAIDLLARSIQTHKLSHAYLLAGAPQIGKLTLAKAFAQAINCQADSVPCGHCRHCRLTHEDKHPDVRVIVPEKNRIKIEAIREMQRTVMLSSVEGRYRVCIIGHFDQATPSAANALLKTLEEPPSQVILVLTASRADALLPTIVSRCQVLPMRLLGTSRIVSALQAQGVNEKRARLLGHLARGRIGWAIAASRDKRTLARREQILKDLVQVVGGPYAARFSWAEKLNKKPDQVPNVLDLLSDWWRDVLLLASGGATPITNIDYEPMLHEWAARCDVKATQKVLKSIRQTAWRLEHNANLRLALEVLMLDTPNIPTMSNTPDMPNVLGSS
jgi:DNA polymerase-3 subunit delta'